MSLDDKIRSIRAVFFDFDGVFTNNKVIVSEDGKESVICNRSDGLGLQRLKSLRIYTAILSTEPNPVVMKRAEKLQIDCQHGLPDKWATLKKVLQDKRLNPQEVAFVGNDINDSECLKNVGFPVVVADALEEVRPLAMYTLSCKGGEGAVRELCDLIYRTRNEL